MYLAFWMIIATLMNSRTPIQRPKRPSNIHHKVLAAKMYDGHLEIYISPCLGGTENPIYKTNIKFEFEFIKTTKATISKNFEKDSKGNAKIQAQNNLIVTKCLNANANSRTSTPEMVHHQKVPCPALKCKLQN